MRKLTVGLARILPLYVVVLVLPVMMLCDTAFAAGTLVFDDFLDTTELTLNGAATTTTTADGQVLRLTQAATSQRGSTFSNTKVGVTAFSTSFTFRISNLGGAIFDCNTTAGADGMVFVIQPVSSSSLGGGGISIGYEGISNSVGIEFDTWCNSAINDPSSNHVGIVTGGSVNHGSGAPFTANVTPDFDDGNLWYAWVDYDGSVLEIRVDQTEVRPTAPLLTQTLDIPTLISSSTAFVGFTSGTGASFGDHDIISWQFTGVSRIPEGKASNLVVLVHGCCTDPNGVSEWDDLGGLILGKIPNSNEWEVVVWDWHEDTPRTSDDYSSCPLCLLDDANAAYDNAISKAILLSTAISAHPQTYKYVHLIAHSAGAKLIDETAKQVAKYFEQFENTEKPFIHLTFLDAYTRTDEDSGRPEVIEKSYGYLENHPHYSEHYVDYGSGGFADATLTSAFNFDITNWGDEKVSEWWEGGHIWPRRWYTRSVESPDRTGDFLGFSLSRESGYEEFCTLAQQFPPGGGCQLTSVASSALCGNFVQPTPCQ